MPGLVDFHANFQSLSSPLAPGNASTTPTKVKEQNRPAPRTHFILNGTLKASQRFSWINADCHNTKITLAGPEIRNAAL